MRPCITGGLMVALIFAPSLAFAEDPPPPPPTGGPPVIATAVGLNPALPHQQEISLSSGGLLVGDPNAGFIRGGMTYLEVEKFFRNETQALILGTGGGPMRTPHHSTVLLLSLHTGWRWYVSEHHGFGVLAGGDLAVGSHEQQTRLVEHTVAGEAEYVYLFSEHWFSSVTMGMGYGFGRIPTIISGPRPSVFAGIGGRVGTF